ncbi:MAG: GGDEF domain-containing protein [Bacilli bacterium]
MNKTMKLLITIIVISVLLGIIGWALLALSKIKDNTAFNIAENRWIDDHKDEVIDVSIPLNLPIYSNNGEGLFFDFLTYFERQTGLELNKVSYDGIKSTTGLNFKIVNKDDVNKNEIVISEDTYVVVRKNKGKLNSLNDIKKMTIGIFNQDKSVINYYLGELNYKYYDDEASLIKGINDEEVEVAIIPHDQYLDAILSNKYYVTYFVDEISNNYVLTLTEKNKTLNSIFKKVFTRWNKLEKSYNDNLSDLYLSSLGIDEIEESNFKSVRYIYGYVSNLPYEEYNDEEFIGINSKYITDFMNLTGVDFEFKEYSSVAALKKAFKNNKVDMMFAYYPLNGITNVNKIYSHISSDYVLITGLGNELFINNLKGLKGNEIYVVKDTYLGEYLSDISKDITIKEYDDIKDILKVKEKNSIIALDKNVYNYYKIRGLENYSIIYEGKLSYDYQFVINNTDNTTLIKMFDNFIWNVNLKKYNYMGLSDIELFGVVRKKISDYIVLIVVGALLFIILLRYFAYVLAKQKKVKVIKKDEKMKFVDLLTSLKNRNYLNHNIEKWDENTIYPQSIILIDLNNVKYINDNYGYEEGDKLIKSAANILINNQLENSDIMRTDGNEFLIYMIGYKEKDIALYIRKLYRELKNIPYGYGAALGYSMIEDDIKTIEDAINEATLDMRTNKELGE